MAQGHFGRHLWWWWRFTLGHYQFMNPSEGNQTCNFPSPTHLSPSSSSSSSQLSPQHPWICSFATSLWTTPCSPSSPPHPLTPSAPQTSQFGRSETPDHRCVIINEGCKKKKKRIWRWGAAESVHNHWKKMFSSSLLFPPLHRFVYLFHLSSHQAMNWAPQLDVFKSTCFWCRRWLHRSDPTLRGPKANLYLLITPS